MFGVMFVFLAGVSASRGDVYSVYQYDEDKADDDDTGFYDNYYDDEVVTVTAFTTTVLDTFTRIRRYRRRDDIRTLNPAEIQDIKGALKEILKGNKLESLTTSPIVGGSYTDIYDYVDKRLESRNLSEEEPLAKKVQKWMPSRDVLIRKQYSSVAPQRDFADEVQHSNPTLEVQHWSPEESTRELLAESTLTSEENTEDISSSTVNVEEANVQEWITVRDIVPLSGFPYFRQALRPKNVWKKSASKSTNLTDSNETTTISTTIDICLMRMTTTTRTTTPAPTTTSPRLDINAIIAIIANLTYDYDWNLTEQFNETLIKYGVPTCPTPTTVTTTTTTPAPYDFDNTSVVSKCFVCGLSSLEIPRDAFCADAFAGDFLPLMPIDAQARGQIAKFRKYCRFLDVHNFVEDPSEPRSIYGRFTGGCAVRWTDLTGVYTQRTCRSRFKPLMGKHFASKRMAKLELALVNVENGCIISPMATLLPLSRGISLYARFHACVCTGSWCNRSPHGKPWKLYTTILWYFLLNKV